MTLKQPYDNIRMLSPEGIFMAFCDMRKAKWYEVRDLAVWVSDNTLQLKFEPSGRSWNSEFERENQCVVCGVTENLHKHHVVPYCYKKWFPAELKEHTSYDLLAICYSHHQEYERVANKKKHEFNKNYNIPVNLFGVPYSRPGALRRSIERTRNLIEKHGDKMPEEALKKLEKWANQPIPDESKTKEKWIRSFYLKSIVENLIQEGKIHQFITDWRDHFVETMKPQFLPKDWLVLRSEASND